MKLSLVAIAGALALAIAAAFQWRSTLESAFPAGEVNQRAAQMRKAFEQEHTPRLRVALSDLPQGRVDPSLTDPAALSPEAPITCDPATPSDVVADTNKAFEWHRFACGVLPQLPEGFFSRPPYLHLSGRSYAALALALQPDRFGTPEWLEKHRRYLHVAELDAAPGLVPLLSDAERFVAGLDQEGLELLAQEVPAMIAGPDLLLRGEPTGDGGSAQFASYPLASWSGFVAEKALVAIPYEPGASCLLREGDLCWRSNQMLAQAQLRRAGWLGAGAIALLLLTLLGIVLRRTLAQRREREARIFMLQTLAHEIRTPAASLKVGLEPLRRRFDALPDDTQGPFLRLCDDVQRLSRVIEASRQYLGGSAADRNFRPVDLPDLRGLIEDLLEPYDDVTLSWTGPERGARLDPYWFGVCVKNLVENARRHGAPPVSVTCDTSGRALVLCVSDGGQGPALPLNRLTAPFVRGREGGGLGLGLNVVSRIVRDMGGRLQLDLAPTRFSFKLRNVLT